MPADPRDGDEAVLERLLQRLEHRAGELEQLVEEKNSAMPERAGMSLERGSDLRPL